MEDQIKQVYLFQFNSNFGKIGILMKFLSVFYWLKTGIFNNEIHGIN